jgi:hypothetical protein
MSYTPLQLIAGSGVLANVGIAKPASLTSAVASYSSLAFVQNLTGTISLANTWGVSNSVVTTLQTLSANTCPALSASIPTAYANTVVGVQTAPIIPATVTGGFGNLIIDTADRYLGDGNLSQFAGVFSAAVGYQQQTTELIYSAVNATTYLGPTFSGMNNLITGDVTGVSLALPALASDLAHLGNAYGLSNLDLVLTPTGLLQQLSKQAGITQGTIPSVQKALLAAGLTPDEIDQLATPSGDATLTLTQLDVLQKKAYQGMRQVTGEGLQNVLDILDVTTPGFDSTNPAVNMSQLLNPVSVFPDSYPSLLTPTDNGAALIYDADATVNPAIITQNPTGCDQLAKIIPPDQAVATRAVVAALAQINGIQNADLPELAAAAANLETLKGLPLVQDLTQPVPDATTSYYQSSFATGTGEFGTFTINDLLGTAAGANVAGLMNQTTSTLNSMTLSSLTSIYANMLDTVQGDYGAFAGPVTIPSGPAAGVYANGNDAFTSGLIPAANTIIANVISTYPVETATLNTAFNSVCLQIKTEGENQARAGINYNDGAASDNQTSVLSFVGSLPQYGQRNSPGGPAEFLNTVADTLVLSGQAIVGALREGRNSAALNTAGVNANNQVPTKWPGPTTVGSSATVLTDQTLTQPPAPVLPAPEFQTPASALSIDYSVAQAVNPATPLPPQQVVILGIGGSTNATVLAAQDFLLQVRILPADTAMTAVISSSAVSGIMTVPVADAAALVGGVYYSIPGWMIPVPGSVNITVTVGSAQASGLANAVASITTESVTVNQTGWFTTPNNIASGSTATLTITGTALAAYTYSGAFGNGVGTLNASGTATVGGLLAPPVGTYQVQATYPASGRVVTQSFTVHG